MKATAQPVSGDREEKASGLRLLRPVRTTMAAAIAASVALSIGLEELKTVLPQTGKEVVKRMVAVLNDGKMKESCWHAQSQHWLNGL